MRKLIVFLLIMFLAFPQACIADFTVISEMDNFNKIFEKSPSVSSWVNSTSMSRAYLWFAVINDLYPKDKELNVTDDGKTLLALIGIGDQSYFMHKDTIYMYLRDTKGLFRQVVIRAKGKYMIYEDTGITYEKAKEKMMSVGTACYEMTSGELIREGEILGIYSKDEKGTNQNQGNNSASSNASNNSSEKSETNGLPVIKGPYSGKTVKVRMKGKTFTIHQSFKTAMDKYQSFFNSYIDFLNSLDKNASDYATKYAEVMEKYVEVSQALENLDDVKDLTEDESLYCLYIVNDINARLLEVMND